eukprot:TRINITY_DN59266_c0_g1_i1.p1 TRINITY_DN59266_c0_g1~~TRINITY_DN59266_c0_g1_i1.p1  ORF type:complete len:319 (+),score=23.87 TRINITY_DN59266_c0_g1_i1:45-1001(+)
MDRFARCSCKYMVGVLAVSMLLDVLTSICDSHRLTSQSGSFQTGACHERSLNFFLKVPQSLQSATMTIGDDTERIELEKCVALGRKTATFNATVRGQPSIIKCSTRQLQDTLNDGIIAKLKVLNGLNGVFAEPIDGLSGTAAVSTQYKQGSPVVEGSTVVEHCEVHLYSDGLLPVRMIGSKTFNDENTDILKKGKGAVAEIKTFVRDELVKAVLEMMHQGFTHRYLDFDNVFWSSQGGRTGLVYIYENQFAGSLLNDVSEQEKQWNLDSTGCQNADVKAFSNVVLAMGCKSKLASSRVSKFCKPDDFKRFGESFDCTT